MVLACFGSRPFHASLETRRKLCCVHTWALNRAVFAITPSLIAGASACPSQERWTSSAEAPPARCAADVCATDCFD